MPDVNREHNPQGPVDSKIPEKRDYHIDFVPALKLPWPEHAPLTRCWLDETTKDKLKQDGIHCVAKMNTTGIFTDLPLKFYIYFTSKWFKDNINL